MEATNASFPAMLLAVGALLLALSYTGRLLLRVTGAKKPPAHRLPPSPWRLPIIGNLHQLIGGLPHHTLRNLSIANGPVMLLYLGRVPTLIVSSPDAAREVLQAQDHVFANRPSLAIPRRLLYGGTDIAFAPHGAYWRSVRKMTTMHLLSPKRVQSYLDVREQEVAKMARRVEEEAARGSEGGIVMQLRELLSTYAKDVIGRILLGTPASGSSGWHAKVDSLIEEASTLLVTFHIGDYFPWLAWVAAVDGTDAKVRSAFERFDGILEEILVATSDEVKRAGTGAQHNAFVHVLLSLMNDCAVMDLRLTRDNVKAILEDLFAAGTDSTIIVLEWAMAELLRNKKVMQKLQNELRRSTTTNSLITEQELPSMEYLRAVIKETIRLHPPLPLVPRESMQQANILGYDVPCRTRVIVNIWAIGRDPAVWDRADEFLPERFVGSEVDFSTQHFQFIPFSAGRRMCPGINFVMPIVELALANLLKRFDWAVPTLARGAPEVVDMKEARGRFTARKNVPLRAVVTLSG